MEKIPISSHLGGVTENRQEEKRAGATDKSADASPFKDAKELVSMRRPKSNFYELPDRSEVIAKAISPERYKTFSGVGMKNPDNHEKSARIISENKAAFADMEKRGISVAKTAFVIGRPPGSDENTPATLLSVVEKVAGESLSSKTSFSKEEASRVDHTFAAYIDHMLDGWILKKPIFLDGSPGQYLYSQSGPVLIDTDPVIIKREEDAEKVKMHEKYDERSFWTALNESIKSIGALERRTRMSLDSYHASLRRLLLEIPPPEQPDAKDLYNTLSSHELDGRSRYFRDLDRNYPNLKKIPVLRNITVKFMQISDYLKSNW